MRDNTLRDDDDSACGGHVRDVSCATVCVCAHVGMLPPLKRPPGKLFNHLRN